MVPVGKWGIVQSGEDKGCFVKVVDDSKNTGGFLILTSRFKDLRECFDEWVENEKDLLEVMNSSYPEVRWIEDPGELPGS